MPRPQRVEALALLGEGGTSSQPPLLTGAQPVGALLPPRPRPGAFGDTDVGLSLSILNCTS